MAASSSTQYWTVDRIMRLIIAVALTAVLVSLVRYLSDVLLPFFVGCFVAFLLQPAVDFNRRLLHTKGRIIPSIITLVDATAIIVLACYLVLPSVTKEMNFFGTILHDVSSGKHTLPPFYRSVLELTDHYFNPENLRELLGTSHIYDLLSQGSSILEGSVEVLMGVLGGILTLIYILFVLIDYPSITRGFKLIIPAQFRPAAMVVIHEACDNVNRYFRGQGFVALCAAILYCIGFTIAGLPLAIPMGLLVGVLYLIPYVQYVTLLPVAAICMVYSLGGYAAFLPLLGKCCLVYVVSQSVCDYIITPHVMKKEMGMNPALILLSLSVWGALLGIIGMIIALPATALIITYYKRYISEGLPRHAQQTPSDSTSAD